MLGLQHPLQSALQIMNRTCLVCAGVVEGVLAGTAAKAGWIKGCVGMCLCECQCPLLIDSGRHRPAFK